MLLFLDSINPILLSILLLVLGGGGGVRTAQAANVTGAEVIAAVTSSQWDDAARDKIVVTINEQPDYAFDPQNLSLVAGTAYILRIENNATNTGKHYYSAPGLFATSAMRKIETNMAEVKADFLGDVELLAPTTTTEGNMATWAEYYFVPMMAGSFEVLCTIGDHALLGMNGTITVASNPDNTIEDTLIMDWDSDYTVDTKQSADPRRSGSDAVWTDAETVEIEILSPYTLAANNMAGYAFSPTNVELVMGRGYVMRIKQTGDGTNDKHYYTAPAFFKSVVTRKLQDAAAELKVPYINAVELTDTVEMAGKETYIDLYIVPTVAGVYNVTCTIAGHAAAGMNGTITVVKTADDSDTTNGGGGDGDGNESSSGTRRTMLPIPSVLLAFNVFLLLLLVLST